MVLLGMLEQTQLYTQIVQLFQYIHHIKLSVVILCQIILDFLRTKVIIHMLAFLLNKSYCKWVYSVNHKFLFYSQKINHRPNIQINIFTHLFRYISLNLENNFSNLLNYILQIIQGTPLLKVFEIRPLVIIILATDIANQAESF